MACIVASTHFPGSCAGSGSDLVFKSEIPVEDLTFYGETAPGYWGTGEPGRQ